LAQCGLPWGPKRFSTSSNDREDDHGEEGEEKGDEETDQEGRSGAQEEENNESGGEEDDDDEGDEEGGAQAQGAGEEAACSDAGAGARSVLAAPFGLGYRRRQLESLRAIESPGCCSARRAAAFGRGVRAAWARDVAGLIALPPRDQ
jgi:hypothetical protein